MIQITDHGAVRELRLNRPPANALSPDLMAALKQAIEAAPGENALALVLSGSPGMFSAGLDVPLLLTLDRAAIANAWQALYTLLRTIANSPIPMAAAITGHAPAGGTVLALFCDWRGAATGNWKMGLNEVQVGIPLPPLILGALRRLVGLRQAERLGVGGLMLSPEQALHVGLVDEVVSPDQLTSRALEWCTGLLKLPRQAMSATRRQARADLIELFEHDLDRELSAVTASWWSEETQSTLRSLAERLASKAPR